MRWFLCILSIFILCASFADVAKAQVASSQSSSEEQPPLDVLDYVPEAYIAEATAFDRECKTNVMMKQNYDCACLSLKFLERRMDLGPTASNATVRDSIQGECIDRTEMAGHEYVDCLRGNAFMEPGTDPEAYCECYVDTYINLIEQYKPTLRIGRLTPLKSRAHITCRNPEFARQFY